MNTQKAVHSVLAALLLVCSGVSAYAAPDNESVDAAEQERRDEAANHFERGLELYQDAALDAALVEFERAYELVSDYRVLFNLARVQTERHEYVEAIRLYERFLEEGGDQVDEAQQTEVRKELKVLESRVAKVTIESNADGAELFIDDKPVGTLPLDGPLVVDSGVSHLRAEKSGYSRFEAELKVAGGESRNFVLTMEPLAADAPPETVSPQESTWTTEPRSKTPFWITFGTTVVLGGTAGTFGILAINKNQQARNELDSPNADSERVDDLTRSGKTFALVGDVLGGAALVGAGLSLYFLVRGPKKTERSQTGGVKDLRLVPHLAGASVRGSF